MATDVDECCSLARTLALRLTDGLAAGTISTTGNMGETHAFTTAGVGGGAGENNIQHVLWVVSLTSTFADNAVAPKPIFARFIVIQLLTDDAYKVLCSSGYVGIKTGSFLTTRQIYRGSCK